MKMVFVLLLCACWMLPAFAQSPRALVKEGNGHYQSGSFPDAEASYRKALEKEPSSVQAQFDLGNALYKQGRFDEAANAFEAVARTAQGREIKAHSFYNLGNARLKAKQTKEAVASYIESLKLQPKDEDTKYNLSYALAQQKQKQNKDQQDQKKDQKKDQDKKDQQKQDQKQDDQKKQQDKQNGKQDQQKQDQQKQDEKKQDTQKQQERKMSKQEAERILDVIRDNDRDARKKLKVQHGARPKTDKDW